MDNSTSGNNASIKPIPKGAKNSKGKNGLPLEKKYSKINSFGRVAVFARGEQTFYDVIATTYKRLSLRISFQFTQSARTNEI